MSEIDIVARLQLRAEQFSSETGARFAEMKSRAQSAAQEVRQSFTGAFGEVQRLAQSALQLPRTASGSLDLSSEIAQLRQAAAATDDRALALRELSVAQTAAAAGARDGAQALKLEADASAVGALAAERDAQALRDRIVALEAVQTELGRTTSATRLNTGALEQGQVSAGQKRAALQQLGFQLGDVATQYASGAKASIIFAQQSGQVIQALTMLTNKTTGFLGFLGGPWGAALGAATIIAAPWVAKLFEGNTALEEAEAKLRKHAAQTEIDRQAQEAFGLTIDGQVEALRRFNAEMEKTLRTQRQVQLGTLRSGEARLQGARNAVSSYDRDIAALRADAAASRRSSDVATDPQASLSFLAAAEEAGRRVVELERKRVAALAEIAEGEQSVRAAQAALIEGDVAAAYDKQAAATARYNAQLGMLYNRLRIGPGKTGIVQERQADGSFRRRQVEGIDEQMFRAQLARITAERAAAEKAAREASQRQPALGTQLRNENAASLLSDARRYSGLREGSAGLSALFSGAGIRIDPEKTAWCAAFVQAVLSGQGIKGTGSLSARSYLGFGKEVSKPQPGDVVILKGAGGAGSGHVGFYAGEGAGGSVLVTGGNQGNSVNTAAFKRSDVLGFRRAPSGSEAYKAEIAGAREALQAAREYLGELRALEGAFDPVAVAARRYAEQLDNIAKLAALPVGDPAHIDAGTAERYRDAARGLNELAVVEARRASLRQSNPEYFAPIKAPIIDQFSDEAQRDKERAADDEQRRAERRIRELSDVYYDLFSGRVDDVWRRFKQMGIGAIADTLARNTLGKLFGTNGKAPAGGDAAVPELRKINTGLDKLGIKLPKDLGKTLIEGAGTGLIAGGAFQSITGGKGSQLGGAIGGALGQFAGKELGKTFGTALGSLGKLAGPLGAIAGGVLGNLVGGLLKKTKTGSATLSIDNGNVGVGGTSGNSSSYRAAASGLAGNVGDALNRIADSLGGSLGGSISVSIGQRDKKYVVDTTGSGRTKGAGTQKFDSEEAAVRAAIADALTDGAIQGISDASKRILAAGGSKLEAAIEKAALIEAIPKQLKAMLDPVGAALDDLNAKWAKTIAALKEGGATSEQMADAEKLYRLQLAETKATTAEASASLKDFLKSLSIGTNSPLSLRDQEGAAKAALQPFLDKIAGGERVDQAAYREAAQSYLDIERQLYGSTNDYFAAFQQIQDATAKAIATIDNAVPIRETKPDPFAQATAEGVQTSNELLGDISNMLQAFFNGNGGGSSGDQSDWPGTTRGFVKAV